MTDRRDALVSLAVAARARASSPATSLGLRVCVCNGIEASSTEDFDADAPTSPDLAVGALVSEGEAVDMHEQSQGSASQPGAKGER